jgi:hypothetical protein
VKNTPASENLNVQKIDDYLSIEGDKKSLIYLSKLINSQAEFKRDCSIQIHPNSSGRVFFNKKSKYGIIIHRLPSQRASPPIGAQPRLIYAPGCNPGAITEVRSEDRYTKRH